MRILHVANFSWSVSQKRPGKQARYYSFDRKVSNGLIRNGHVVWDFSYRDMARHLAPPLLPGRGQSAMMESLLSLARAFEPDLVLFGLAESIDEKGLLALRDALPKSRFAQWWVDDFSARKLPSLRSKHALLDAFFATTAPSHYLPLLDSPKSTTDCYYLPNIVDCSVETGRSFQQKDHDYDLFFAGTATGRGRLLDRLKAGLGERFGLFADDRPLTGAELVRTVEKSRMGLNLSRHTDIPLYSSDRLAQLAGNGCLVLSPQTPGMQELFSEEEILYFADEEELFALLARYSGDDIAWRRVAEAGWQRAQTDFNERRVTRFMVEAALGGCFTEDYQWLKGSAGSGTVP